MEGRAGVLEVFNQTHNARATDKQRAASVHINVCVCMLVGVFVCLFACLWVCLCVCDRVGVFVLSFCCSEKVSPTSLTA